MQGETKKRETNLFVQTVQTSIWVIGSIQEGAQEEWEGKFVKVWLEADGLHLICSPEKKTGV